MEDRFSLQNDEKPVSVSSLILQSLFEFLLFEFMKRERR